MEISNIGKSTGIKIDMGNANLLLIKADKGFIMCGYLDMETAEKLKDAACIVKGVKNFDDMLNGKIVKVTTNARELGIKEGMSGKDALKILEK
ncbi:conserved hypothetical protein [groundwater metagenome]|uniref:UmuC domain-containing protein n=1 Tax=groundwater metagenome TaxID=717931 RepID=A0A098ECC2_9ZZZZ